MRKKYHPAYLNLKSEFDPHVVQWITTKEELIVSSPLSHDQLKHRLSGSRRYKGGKLRILYALSNEKPEYWSLPPDETEILFLYVDIRKDETYHEALRLLRKHNLL